MRALVAAGVSCSKSGSLERALVFLNEMERWGEGTNVKACVVAKVESRRMGRSAARKWWGMLLWRNQVKGYGELYMQVAVFLGIWGNTVRYCITYT